MPLAFYILLTVSLVFNIGQGIVGYLNRLDREIAEEDAKEVTEDNIRLRAENEKLHKELHSEIIKASRL